MIAPIRILLALNLAGERLECDIPAQERKTYGKSPPTTSRSAARQGEPIDMDENRADLAKQPSPLQTVVLVVIAAIAAFAAVWFISSSLGAFAP